MNGRPKTIILVSTIVFILLVFSGTILLGYAFYWMLAALLGYPPSINLPVEARLAGLILISAGIGVLLDVTRYRHPRDILISTSETYTKLIRRKPLKEKTNRTEPFIPKGPYVYVRNPMYFGAVVLAFGFALVLSSTPLLLWGLVVACWFWFVIIPLEEKELEALFGMGYTEYRQQVPRLFPYGRKYKSRESKIQR